MDGRKQELNYFKVWVCVMFYKVLDPNLKFLKVFLLVMYKTQRNIDF
jgi:hypothetical protein